MDCERCGKPGRPDPETGHEEALCPGCRDAAEQEPPVYSRVKAWQRTWETRGRRYDLAVFVTGRAVEFLSTETNLRTGATKPGSGHIGLEPREWDAIVREVERRRAR